VIKHPEDTIRIKNTFKDENKALFDPDTQVVKIYDPAKSLKATISNPTKVSLGVFYIEYDIPSDATEGEWVAKWKAVKGTYKETEPFYFNVEAD